MHVHGALLQYHELPLLPLFLLLTFSSTAPTKVHLLSRLLAPHTRRLNRDRIAQSRVRRLWLTSDDEESGDENQPPRRTTPVHCSNAVPMRRRRAAAVLTTQRAALQVVDDEFTVPGYNIWSPLVTILPVLRRHRRWMVFFLIPNHE